MAFFAVFLSHALPAPAQSYFRDGFPPWLANLAASLSASGGLGVDLFFLLSSYLITELLIREERSRGTIDLRSFYVRRALRIWPLYYAFLAFAFWVLPRVTKMPRIALAQQLGFLLLAGNWTTAHLGYIESPAAPLWSVSIEEQFYLAWPLLLAMLGTRRIRTLAAGFLVVAWTTRVVLLVLDVPHPGIWTNTLARLDPIALGAVIAFALDGRSPDWSAPRRVATWIAGAAALPLSIYVFGINGSGFLLSERFLGRWGSLLTYPIVAIACGAILLATLQAEPTLAWLRSGPLVYLGRISYGLYVVHVLCLDVAHRFVPSQAFAGAVPVQVLVALLMSVVAASLSYQLFERPFLLLKQRFTRVPSRPDFRD